MLTITSSKSNLSTLESVRKMHAFEIHCRVRTRLDAVTKRRNILLAISTRDRSEWSALTLHDPQCHFKLELEVTAKLWTPPYGSPSSSPISVHLESDHQGNDHPARGVVYITFYLTEFQPSVDDNDQGSTPMTEAADADFDPLDFEDILNSDWDHVITSTGKILNHDDLKMNVVEKKGEFLFQGKSALVRQFEKANPSTGDEKLRNLHAFLDQLQDAQYVEALSKALEELQGLCDECCSNSKRTE